MARAGRKRKQGKRHPNGQLVRTPKRDKGTPELQLQRLARIGAVAPASREIWLSQGAEAALAGTMPNKAERKRGVTGVQPVALIDTQETIDPIGRAWAAGLLDGDGISAQDLRDAGRRFAVLYWRKLPGSSPVSGLYAKMVAGLVEELPAGVDRDAVLDDADARDERQEAALNRILDGLNRLGRRERAAVDALTLDPFADAGPAWLDWLIAARSSALPALSGAIARKWKLSDAHRDQGELADATIGMRVTMYGPDRPVEPGDWHLFLPASLLLRWSDMKAQLDFAIRGLTVIYCGKADVSPH